MGDLFGAIGDVFTAIWKTIKKVIAIVLIVIAIILVVWACIFCPPLGGVLFGIALTATQAIAIGLLCLVGAFLIDSETAKSVVGRIGEAVGDAAGSVAEVVGNTAGEITGGLLDGLFSSSGGLWILGGIAAFFLLTGNSDGEDKGKKVRRTTPEPVSNKPRSTPKLVVDNTKGSNADSASSEHVSSSLVAPGSRLGSISVNEGG